MIKQVNSLDEYLIKQPTTGNINEQGLSSLFRAVLEPVLENNTDGMESDVILKVTNRDLFTGLLTRLEFSDIHFVDYGEDVKGRSNLDETDFLLVMTSGFISFLAWKQNGENLQYTAFTNSSEIDKIISLLDENAKGDFSYLREKYQTNELTTSLTNCFIHKLASMLNNTQPVNTDVIDNQDLSTKINYLTKKARYISHEVKNQLSICDLYSGIIKRYCENNNINNETINHSVNCIDTSVKISGSILSQLKTLNSKELKLYKTNKLIETAVDISKVYLTNRNIKLIVENDIGDEIFVDATMFVSTIVNLIKNAAEAFDGFEEKNNWIKVTTQVLNDDVSIRISNNAKPITNPEAIFDEGFTTKTTGSGLGLFICKQNTEEQCGQLNLIKSNEKETVFELRFSL